MGQWYPTITDTFINVQVKCKTQFLLKKGCLYFYFGLPEEPLAMTKDILISGSQFVGNSQDRCVKIDGARSITIVNTSFEKCGIKHEVCN